MESDIKRFIDAILKHQFVQAHELLEEDWRAYKKSGDKISAKVLQGLINGATALALYHTKNRKEAYERVWKVFLKYEPLLKEVHFKNMSDYEYASKLLKQKNEELVN